MGLNLKITNKNNLDIEYRDNSPCENFMSQRGEKFSHKTTWEFLFQTESHEVIEN